MANKLNGFLDNVVSGALSPKGNLGDFAHGARLYVDDAHRLSPKHKFLYHVVFEMEPDAVKIPQLSERHKNEVGMLVKNIDLPRYSIQMEGKHKYNSAPPENSQEDSISTTSHERSGLDKPIGSIVGTQRVI